MARSHITISDDLYRRISEYAKIRKITFSKSVEELSNYGLSYLESNKNYEIEISLFEKILGKQKYITLLLEQFYSDMYMEAKTNPKDNEGLRIIKNKMFKKDFYD